MRNRRLPAILAAVTWVSMGCSGPTSAVTSTPTVAVAAASQPTSQPAPMTSSPSVPRSMPSSARPSPVGSTGIGDGPPEASLAAEGGDPVAGQLGTYVWLDGGSDSPWLQGAPIRVGRGEPLSVSFDPPIDVAWQARSVAAGSAGPAGATPLGDGNGSPRFSAPGPGTWTVEVHVVFDRDVGSASYFWRLEISG